ncbi:bifunctional hydroxymethylpyrimidine kinase/phosphomethylpyrimidine kinase [Flexibacterium corallicola]|uniref:bifunctional hydroxymethylpyrimidine kinase/phosphomethylpyrimidine kinase n=1 Tax=Flexibacterium corallicola TaxID=3037259 RepID=UPI00286F67AB|nr:bifunctional hydroxymethylpyrimidine kinase/phosphomethylpyrimidine kinase [Pseudovibrio sp. M1P-2-3]
MTPIAVTIAGSDSGGAAGVQADLKTFSALGVYGATVFCALTAQNTKGVSAIHEVPADFIFAQIKAVFTDLAVNAVKIGMVSTCEAIEAVSKGLQQYNQAPIVLDPVMVASSGDLLLHSDAMDGLKKKLFPLALIITPNMAEAALLLDRPIARNAQEFKDQAKALLDLGVKSVLLKGGHGLDQKSDDLYLDQQGTELWLRDTRYSTENTHGTGCTLSSAIASGLAKGLGVETALQEAKDYISGAIRAADTLHIGSGHGPVHHFYKVWK